MKNVYIIGDSISIGYTPEVTRLLEGKAKVVHNPDNAQYSAWILRHLKNWLGDTKWDLIHFNCGIWDLHHLKPTADPLEPCTYALVHEGVRRTTDAQYEANLKAIVDILKATGAKLIWATITPLPVSEKQSVHTGSEIPYNRIARRVMEANQIPINDLFAHTLPQLGKIQPPEDCHFTDEGYRYLGKEVASVISTALNL